jgi:L,D-transpeptidase catalytic domain/Putative peptidoglycan binding domain
MRTLGVAAAALVFAGGADAATLTLSVPAGPYRYDASATFSGALNPVQSGVPVGVYSNQSGKLVGQTTTAGDGTYHVTGAITRGGQYTAIAQLTPSTTATSPAASLQMKPRLTVTLSGKRVFGGKLVLHGRLLPAAATGALKLRVFGKWRRIRVGVEGWYKIAFPTSRPGKVPWRVALQPAAGYETVDRRGEPVLKAPHLSFGDRGVAVRALEAKLRALHYTIGGVDSVYGSDTVAAVLAFQKVHRMARTGRVDAAFWSRLARAGVPRAFVPRGTHIEVSKTLQVMYEVVNGKVARATHVSTGATGNTPVGRFRVYYLHPGYNAKGMYYSLFFHGNFAIHGYASVPPWPASHGCVRTPTWFAKGFWDRWARIGTQVYVFA